MQTYIMVQLFSKLVIKLGIFKASVISLCLGLLCGVIVWECLIVTFDILVSNSANLHLHNFSSVISNSKYSSSIEIAFVTIFTVVTPLSYMLRED